MNRRARKAVFYLFFSMFLPSSVWVILLATGYTIHWKNLTLVKTGLILVDTTPKQADIALDNVVIASKSPLRIARLIPQDYHITITRAGYSPWEKTVTVQEGQTSLLSPVFPLPTPTVTRLASLPAGTSTLLSPDATLLAVAEPSATPELTLRDTLGQITPLFRPLAPGALNLVSWSPSGDSLLFTYPSPDKYSIIHIPDRAIVSVNALVGTQPNTIIWHPVYAGYFYYVSNRTLYAYDSTHTRKKLIIENIDKVISGAQGILATREGETIHEFIFIPFSDETPRSMLSGGRTMHAEGLSDQYFWTTENDTIYVYPFFEKPEALITAPGSHALIQYTDTGSTLMSWNDIEMYRTPFQDPTSHTLLTRFGSHIQSVRALGGSPYILAQTNNKLVAVASSSIRPDAPSALQDGTLLSWSPLANTALVRNEAQEYSLLVFPSEVRR